MAELGATASEQRALARASSRGVLIRPRKGVYALPDVHADVILAAQYGGRLTGVSALEHHGLWVPPARASAGLHVEVPVSIRVPPPAAGTDRPRIHWLRDHAVPRFGVAPSMWCWPAPRMTCRDRSPWR